MQGHEKFTRFDTVFPHLRSSYCVILSIFFFIDFSSFLAEFPFQARGAKQAHKNSSTQSQKGKTIFISTETK
jgi:hypothetical protein